MAKYDGTHSFSLEERRSRYKLLKVYKHSFAHLFALPFAHVMFSAVDVKRLNGIYARNLDKDQ